MGTLVESDFPVRPVSEETARERMIRRAGHINALHPYWARKALSVSRTVLLAALLPDDPECREELHRLVRDAARWEIAFGSRPGLRTVLHRARQAIRKAFDGRAPRVLDPFAGGGSIPLEALRLGCEAHALDLNPLAVLLGRTVLEYPQRFGQLLLDVVREWGNRILERARRELSPFYPVPDRIEAFLWARTIPCSDPACGAEIPLLRHLWLARRGRRRIAIRLTHDREGHRIGLEIVGQSGEPVNFNPEHGTVRGGQVTCPLCGAVTDPETTRRAFRSGRSGQRMIAVVGTAGGRGKVYLPPSETDMAAWRAAEAALGSRLDALHRKWGMVPVPDEPLPERGGLGFRVHRYGMSRWGDLFNPRQKLALIVFADAIRDAFAEMVREGIDPDAARAASTALALVFDQLAASMSVLCRWRSTGESVAGVFDRQALSMLWNYAELNPVGQAPRGWASLLDEALEVLRNSIAASGSPGTVRHGDAAALPWPDGFFDAVVTDPPYYDSVGYSGLSEFFLVWLRRTVGTLYPDLLSPSSEWKEREIVGDPAGQGGRDEGRKAFQVRMTAAFREIARVLREDGISVVFFGHRSPEAWEAVIQSAFDAGLQMTAAWPVGTEMGVRLRAHRSDALSASLCLVFRRRPANMPAVSESDFLIRLREHMRERLSRFWSDGVRGADFRMSALGAAAELFGRFGRVEKAPGIAMNVSELLEHARLMVGEITLELLMRHAAESLDEESRGYLLWLVTAGSDSGRASAEQDDGGLAERLERAGLIRAGGARARPLSIRERAVTLKNGGRPGRMIDALHLAVWLWKSGRAEMVDRVLRDVAEKGEAFRIFAQAVSELLPERHPDRTWISGFVSWMRGRGPASRQLPLWEE